MVTSVVSLQEAPEKEFLLQPPHWVLTSLLCSFCSVTQRVREGTTFRAELSVWSFTKLLQNVDGSCPMEQFLTSTEMTSKETTYLCCSSVFSSVHLTIGSLRLCPPLLNIPPLSFPYNTLHTCRSWALHRGVYKNPGMLSTLYSRLPWPDPMWQVIRAPGSPCPSLWVLILPTYHSTYS